MQNFYYIKTKLQLQQYAFAENNSYWWFILEKIENQSNRTNKPPVHIHHIIPRHFGGSNASWNLITLSIEDHAYCHKLLYENYHNLYDLGASNMLQGQIKKGSELIRKATHQKMKKNKVGFYNSKLQSDLAKRPKVRKPYARNFYIKTALQNGFILQWVKTGQIVRIKPDECGCLTDVINKLMQYEQMKEKQAIWKNTTNKAKYYGITALTRTLTGHIDVKTNKSVYSFLGWRVLGVLLPIS